MLGYRPGINPGGIGNLDASSAALLDIDVVVAGAGLNNFQILGMGQKRGIDPGAFGDECIRIADLID